MFFDKTTISLMLTHIFDKILTGSHEEVGLFSACHGIAGYEASCAAAVRVGIYCAPCRCVVSGGNVRG